MQALSSHQIHYPVPAAPGFIFFDLCFLRDPIDRLRSTYDYFRQRPAAGDPLSDAANTLEFGEFFRCLIERFPEQVDNPQVNLLANGAADRETTPEDLAPAIQRMAQTSFLGVVDCFDQSILAGESWLRDRLSGARLRLPAGQRFARPGRHCRLAQSPISGGLRP